MLAQLAFAKTQATTAEHVLKSPNLMIVLPKAQELKYGLSSTIKIVTVCARRKISHFQVLS